MKIKLNGEVAVNLESLVESRLLVQANSGGGKSWAIRRIIEQAFGHVQIIVLDPEGEFTNLREEYDFVFAGKGGDAPAESRSAALLVRRLLELKASAIVDLYELPPHERKHFVKLFCEAMVNAPKELWHDCLVIIDEAHIFAPEKGESEAMGAVIDLATRGRKRGYGVVLATQRLSKLNKDAAAECNNKMIGRASQDIDMKRAADELGFSSREQMLSLRLLRPGEFYVFGPAISDEVTKMKVGDVKVKPAPRGVTKKVPPPPTEKVKKILAQLADLPQEAQQEATTIVGLKQELTLAKRKIVELGKGLKPAEPVALGVSQWREYGKKHGYWAYFEGLSNGTWEVLMSSQKMRFRHAAQDIERSLGALLKLLQEDAKPIKPIVIKPNDFKEMKLEVKVSPQFTMPKKEVVNQELGGLQSDISGPEQRILDAIAWSESIGKPEPEQVAVAFLADYTYGGGGFNNPKGSLRTKGLIEYRGSRLALTEAGRQVAHQPEGSLTTEQLHQKVLGRLPGPEQRLLKPLLDAYPNDLSNDELAQASGYQAGSGGFNNPKGRLRTLGLAEYPSAGRVKAASLLFIE